ncbi:MAG: hypothetical protein Q9178_001800 [Gyalolechia marmorata]
MDLEQRDEQPNLSTIGHQIHQRLAALESYDPLITQAQRYELWAENLGLYQSGHSSLDYRFRDAPSIFMLTHRLLNHLLETLPIVEEAAASGGFGPSRNIMAPIGTAGTKPTGANDKSEDPDDDLDSDEEEMLASYQDGSLTGMALVRLESIIDRLYRLSFRIQDPAARLGVAKASQYRDFDEDTNIDLMNEYAKADRTHVRELLKQISGTSADEYLVSRLSQANTLRRKQFGQWRRHKIKLKSSLRPEKPVEESKRPPGHRTLPIPGNRNPSRPSTATAIADKHIDLDDGTSLISTSTYIQPHDADAAGINMPTPPRIPITKREFECPYCYILCSRKTLEKQNWE